MSRGAEVCRPQWLTHTSPRPKSKYADWEDPPQEGEPFDYDAVPGRFYFEVESAGNIEPDAIIQQGIKVLQQKLATLIHDLSESDGGGGGGGQGGAGQGGANGGGDYRDGGGLRSPGGADANMQDGGWGDGFATPYGNGGNQSAWGGGISATPYGQQGQNSWN